MATLEQIRRWQPGALGDAGTQIKNRNGEFVTGIDRTRHDIHAANTTWQGEAYWAAYNRIGTDHDAGIQLSQEITTLGDAMVDGGSLLTGYHSVLLGYVAAAEEAGFIVTDEWAVQLPPGGTADRNEEREGHQGLITTAHNELMSTLGDVQRAITDAANAVRVRGDSLGDDTGELGNEPGITQSGDSITVETGDENDTVTVDEDSATHAVTVTINGVPHTYPAEQAKNITINTHGGDDQIAVSDGTLVGVKVAAGAGNDTVFGGRGRDYIDAGSGDDLVNSNEGDDVVYGGDGADALIGFGGDDYIDGGSGDDKIAGSVGNDILSGGLGNDFIEGNQGDDKLYSGAGTDTLSGSGINTAPEGSGNDTIYAQDGEDTINRYGDQPKVVNVVLQDIPDSVTVSGTPEFRERVLADLEFFRSSPTGQQMLAALGTSGHTVTITEGIENRAGPTDRPNAWFNEQDNRPGTGSSGKIEYNTQTIDFGNEYAKAPWATLPPSVTLFHELAHTYDYTHGTLRPGTYDGTDSVDHGLNDRERVATGLPIDHDNDSSTPEQLAPEHPVTLTENELRGELGLLPRDHYGIP